MAYLVGLLILLAAVGVAVFLSKAEKMSDVKQALYATGVALGTFVVLVAIFGVFYESPF